MLGAGRIFSGTFWTATDHSHSHVEIIVMVQGQLAIEINGAKTIANPGSVAIYPPGTIHREYSAAKTIDFYFLAMQGRCDDIDGYYVHDDRGRLRMLAQWIYEEQEAHSTHQKNMDSLTAAFMAELESLAKSKPREPFEMARAYMHDHLQEPLSLHKLSSLASLTKYHFLRRYKEYTGRTPIEDLRIMRVETACELLLSTDMPIKEIARKTGFCDEFYFSRVFKHYRSVSPGSIRKRSCQGKKG
jgi:AraC-like DNA-binding protein